MEMKDERLERMRQRELDKRIAAAQKGRFRITTLEGDHPFFTVVRVVGERFLSYDVEIHSLTSLEENYCTCGDYRHNGLGVCKHIIAALDHLSNESPDAFKWTKAKNPHLEDALYPKWVDGREVLYLRTDREEVLARASEFFDENHVLYDLSVVTTDEWQDFLEFLRSNSIHITTLARDLMARWKRLTKIRTIVSNHLPDGFPSDLLRHSTKKFQQEAASKLLGLGRLVLDAPQGWGKRVATILAMAFVDRFVGPENQYVIVGPQEFYTQWRLLMELFTGHPLYKLTLRGGRKRLYEHLDHDKFFYATYETLLRDGWIIQEIEPTVLVFDEIQRIERWRGSRGSVIKSLDAPYVAFVGHGIRAYPELVVNLAQYLDPHGFGPMWRFLEEHAERDRHGRITRYDVSHAWSLVEPFYLDTSGRTHKSQPKRPRIRAGITPYEAEREAWMVGLKKLNALTAVKYAWEEREAEQARELVRNMRLSAGAGDPEGRRPSSKMEALMAILKAHALEGLISDGSLAPLDRPGEHLSKRVVIFTHWPELLEPLQQRLAQEGYSTFVLKEEADLARWDDHNVALMYDKPFNPMVQGVDLLIHYDWPWEKAMLEDGRRKLVTPREDARLVEVSLFSRHSIEDVGLNIVEKRPEAIGEWFDKVPTTSLPSPERIRLACTRLALYLNERLGTGRWRVQSGQHRRSRRVPMLGKGMEIENPGSFVRPKPRFQMDSIFDSGPRAVISKQILWESGIAMPDYAETPVLCDVKHTAKGFLTTVMSSTSKGIMAWRYSDLSRLALALNKASFILALRNVPRELGAMLFGVKVTSLEEELSRAAGTEVSIHDVMAQTMGYQPSWDESSVAALAEEGEWAKIAELSKEDLEAAWNLLAHIVKNGSFRHSTPSGAAEVSMDPSFLPQELVTRLREG